MHPQWIEPLEPASWFAALQELGQSEVNMNRGGSAALLRRAFYLLQLTPGPLRGLLRHDLDEVTYERLLNCGAFESAALWLVGDTMLFELSRQSPAEFEARVWFLTQRERTWMKSESAAVALMRAWCQCLCTLRHAAEAGEPGLLHRDPHTTQFAPRQRPTEH